jgi:16S rRNA (adenine1518-N6/adenine1519-N6)-dimethyltransferase
MRQRYGQNFLIDKNYANKIIASLSAGIDDKIIEIGPGKGALTKILNERFNNVSAVEIDGRLIENLKNDFPNIQIFHQNALDFDYPCDRWHAVSNLPYESATAIIGKLISMPSLVDAVFMVQKEAAMRIVAKTGSKEYGYFTLFCSYYAHAELLFDVQPSCFRPEPKITSSVIKLVNKNPPPPNPQLFPLIKHCFSMRRKTILNTLSTFTGFNKQACTEILNKCGLCTLMRPQEIDLKTFEGLTRWINI